MIKAIDTVYKGYKFRSRLEARWAVFFDGCGFVWEYEGEGYDINGVRYLPDFLINGSFYAEIKHGESDEGHDKCLMLAVETGKKVLLISGEPYRGRYEITLYPGEAASWDGGIEGPLEFAGCRKCKGIWIITKSDSPGPGYYDSLNCTPECNAYDHFKDPHPEYGAVLAAYDSALSARFEFLRRR